MRVTSADGKVITGVLKNEDSYSLQVMGTDNQLHMFDRAKVRVVYQTKTLMPTDYDKRLAPDEFRNLLAYLTRLHVPAPTAPAGRGGADAAAPAADYLVFVGSYTNPTPTTTSASKGIYSFRFDTKTGTLSPIGLAAATVNPAHVWVHPNGKFLYAANWETGDKAVGDTVSAFAIDHQSGSLDLLNKVSARGDRANQVVLDPGGKVAVTVTYNSGTVTAKGTLTMIENVPSLGRTPRNITIDPTNEYLISANQGGENVVVFNDHNTGHLTPTGSQQPVPQAGGLAFVKAQ